MKVTKIAKNVDLVSEVTGMVLEELKEMLWREAWKEMIELPQAKVEVRRREDGSFEISAEL